MHKIRIWTEQFIILLLGGLYVLGWVTRYSLRRVRHFFKNLM